ncbi:hypothetical protein Ocin01_09246 [Orchesella cincta]|uniref:Uncharacterized protein n=1 Tax=Orchesella cincta TaxID=48709 RepID=A0A1D2MWL1_ORCCI|nr:hypothetical protein Ocin01_09246 [Orchesella cincta]
MILKLTWFELFLLLPFYITKTDASNAFLQKETGNLQSNIWKEERQAIRIPEDPGTLYGNERHCINPEPAELTTASNHQTGIWSNFLSIYTLDAGDELETWLIYQEKHDETANERQERAGFHESLLPVLVPLVFAIFLSASVVFIPLLGAVGFHVLVMLWWVITHPEMKRCGRRSLIMFEQIKRKRQEILLRESMIKATRSRFYLPEFFRLYSDEDVPTELEEPNESDGLEDFIQAPTNEQNEETKNEHESLSGLEVDVEAESGDEGVDNDGDENQKPTKEEVTQDHDAEQENKGMFKKLFAWGRPG